MKNIKSFICALGAIGATFAFTGCDNDYDDVAPGSYVEMERIETFPGDTVMVSGTVSNGSVISSVSLVCEAWELIMYMTELLMKTTFLFMNIR